MKYLAPLVNQTENAGKKRHRVAHLLEKSLAPLLLLLTASINLQGVSGGCQNALAFTAREKAVGHIAPEVSNIVLFDFCTQQMHQVTVNGASWRPVWSPDGSTIAYVSTADSHGYSQIYVQPADAGESEAINVSAGLLYARFPAWSSLS